MYGLAPPRKLPVQDGQKLLLLADRWQRAYMAQSKWAEAATKCVNFLEGRQWTEEQVRARRAAGRPALTYNQIAPLARLMAGYFAENRIDTTYQPSSDAQSREDVAEALTLVRKQISQTSAEPDIDVDVWGDGIATGRGFYREKLDFEDNDLGEIIIDEQDPFSVYIDPEATKYDPKKWGYTVIANDVSLDEIEASCGQVAAGLVRPFVNGQTPSMPVSMLPPGEDVRPMRGFGGKDGDFGDWWDTYYGLMGPLADPYRKTIRVLEHEYWVSRMGRVFIDIETGDKSIIPEDWDDQKISKVLWWSQNVAKNRLRIAWKRIRQVRWTITAGDVIVYDDWSKFDHLSLVGFFPYFRHGVTRGAIDDLIDPQSQVNTHESNWTDSVNRSGNPGWSYHEDALTPEQEARLARFGSTPGFRMKWKGDKEPKRIEPGSPAVDMQRLAADNADKLSRISGINESMQGMVDKVQSGKAVLAQQKQGAIGIQPYMTSMSRTKRLLGRNALQDIQKYYTEQRIVRVMGEDGKLAMKIINQEQTDPTNGLTSKLLDVTRGKYEVATDESPLSATFANGQFEEMMGIMDRVSSSPAMAIFGDLMIEQSSLPNKEEWTERFKLLRGLTPPPGAVPGQPGAPGQPMPPQPGAAQPSPVQPGAPAGETIGA